MPEPKVPTPFVWIISVGGLVMMLLFWAPERARLLTGKNDFMAFYAGGRLIGTPGLYDAATVRRLQVSLTGVTGDATLPRIPPFFSVALWPLAQLPFQTAYEIWVLLNAAAIAGFIALWPAGSRTLAWLACCCSVPLAASFANGQHIPFLLLWVALALRLAGRGHLFLAGLALSLCAAKYHLFLTLPLVLCALQLWRMVAGATTGVAALLAVSFLAAGRNWPAQYLRVLGDPALDPSVWAMPNLHGFFYSFPYSTAFVVAASAAVAAACWVIARRLDFRHAMAAALLGGLLVSYHCYNADCAILIPALLLLLHTAEGFQQGLVVALLTPPMYFLQGRPVLAHLPQVALLVLLGLLVWQAMRQGAAAQTGDTLGLPRRFPPRGH